MKKSKAADIQLSKDQEIAVDGVEAWLGLGGERILTMGGFAGCGKTTVLSYMAAGKLDELLVAYVAYTGRAASLLARKFAAMGVKTTSKTMLPDDFRSRGRMSERAERVCYTVDSPEAILPFVGTIHRLLYRPVIDPATEELRGWAQRVKLDRDYDLIVIDEASMVGDDILEDLTRFDVPILAVGDHGQLPPVMSKGNLMKEPKLRLEKIHRQAEGNPIIQLAHHIRQGGLLREFRDLQKKSVKRTDDGLVEFVGKPEVDRVLETSLPNAGLDHVSISWTNKMRVRLNMISRRALGIAGPPRKGDLVVALKNAPPVMNGMRGQLVSDSQVGKMPWYLLLDIDFPEENIGQDVIACAAQFNREYIFNTLEELQARGINVETMSGAGSFYDFGYALTCHKMQGSSAKHVVVYLDRPEDPDNDDYRRWMYTAVTRSSERLTVCR